ATLDGATALGLASEIGSLVPGKHADAIAVDFGAFQHAPCYDPVSHLVHVAGRDQVTDVWIGGRRMVRDGTLTELDALELAARAYAVSIDITNKAPSVARLHRLEAGVQVDSRLTAAETLAAQEPGSFDVVTCLELLEHVPDPASTTAACATLVKPRGLAAFAA